ncbi:MAG: hydrogenase nickel incorporation protein HypB [Chloroflexota bacterium]
MQVPIVEKILSANDRLAQENQALLDAHGVLGVNLMASPGAGKTSLIEATIDALAGRLRLGAVDGDIATSLDADRIAARGIPAVQINTGGGCHLDANMLKNALPDLPLDDMDLLLVENVGNLVCPANFQIGTHLNVVIASTPEGDDKPYKYPPMYTGVDVLIVNKMDLLPYLDFDLDYFKRGVAVLNPDVVSFEVSCKTGQGIAAWVDWLVDQVAKHRAGA